MKISDVYAAMYTPSTLTSVAMSSMASVMAEHKARAAASSSSTPSKRFTHRMRIDQREFSQMDDGAKNAIMRKMADAVANQLLEEYMGIREIPDEHTIEIGIDILVRD